MICHGEMQFFLRDDLSMFFYAIGTDKGRGERGKEDYWHRSVSVCVCVCVRSAREWLKVE